MKYRRATWDAIVGCPIEGCDAEITVQIMYEPVESQGSYDLDIITNFPTLDLHMIEHGAEPVIEESDV